MRLRRIPLTVGSGNQFPCLGQGTPGYYGPLRLRAGVKSRAADCLPPGLGAEASESLLDIFLNPAWVTL